MSNKNTLANLGAVTAGKVKTSGITAFNELVITKVYPNPNQPRKQFDDIEELAANIKEHGLLQPITVVKKDDGYMIVSGERRYKAHLHNGAKTIMALILTSSDEQVEELTLIENIQRSDLTDFEVAKHILRLWESGRYAKKSDLATRIGKSDSFVSKAFSCFKLDSEIIDHIEENKKDIPISVMDEIARVKDKGTQKEVYEKYSAGEITRDEIKDFKPKKNEIKKNLRPTFIYCEPLKYEDGATLQSEFIDKNLPFENINTIGRGAYGNKACFSFDDMSATFVFIGLKTGDYYIESDSNEEYNLSITKVDLLEEDLLLENELSVIGEVHPESFSCIEFKRINAYFFYTNLKNPNDFQGFKKGEKYKLVLKRLETKEQNVSVENFPWEKSYSEQYFYVRNWEIKLTKLLKDGYKQPFKEMKMNNAYEQKIHDLLLEKSPKEINSHVDMINLCASRNGYKKTEGETIYLYSNGCSVRLLNRYDEIIFDLLKENLELKKELEELKQNQPTPKEKAPLKDDEPKETKEPKKTTKCLKDGKEIALLELFGETVTINYTNYEVDMGLDYKQAKKIIAESKQDLIPFNAFKGTDERAYRLIDEDVRTVKDNHIVLIPSS